MPNYTFKNFKTEEIKEESMMISEMESFIKGNPDWKVLITPIGKRDNFVGSRYTNIPLDNNLKGIYDNINKQHHGNKMNY